LFFAVRGGNIHPAICAHEYVHLETTAKHPTASLVYLVILGVLAMGIVLFRSKSQEISDQLNSQNIRIRFNTVVISDSLRAMLIEPRDQKVSQAERKRIRDAMEDLRHAVEELKKNFPREERIVAQVKTLENFLNLHLDVHVTSTYREIETDPVGTLDSFVIKHAAVSKQRDELLQVLTNEFQKVREDTGTLSFQIAIAGTVGIFLVVLLFIRSYRSASAAVTIPLKQLVDVIERMRNGDFTLRVSVASQDEFGVVGDGLNRLADDLSVLVGQVQRSGVQVNITATQIAATSREQQSTTTEIAATTAEIGATSKQISATSRELDKTMNEVVEVAHETAELAGSGQTGIARMENTMHQIMEASGSISGKLAVLNEKTANVNSVVTTITKVADQTNLLSLNAAIEAEKAGEYGLGFAVVAMEIRRLADQTAVATYDIEKMVKEMQSAVVAGVMGMDKFSEEVRRGVDEIRQVSTQLAQIIHQVQTLTPRFATVSEGMHAQATGAQQISETLTQLSEAAHQTADSLRQSNLAIEQLNEAARGLQTSVARFKLEAK
jgi:methyl-accepting chemotaxis protein